MKKWMSIAFLTLAILMLAMPVYAETDAEAAEETENEDVPTITTEE